MIDLRQTPEYANYLRKIGWIVERIEDINYAVRKIPILGSIIKVQRAENIRYKDIKILSKLEKKYRAFQIIIEPGLKSTADSLQFLKKHGFKLSKSPFLPTKTIQIDLTKSEEELLEKMHHKTRYNIKKATKNGLKIIISSEIERFSEFWHKCSFKRRVFFLSLKKEIFALYKTFEEKTDLLFAYYKGELAAAVFLIHSDKVSYYMYAASSEHGKKLFAPTLIAWEAIRLSKTRSSKIFDFEGIYDDRFPIKSWKGFSRFKKSFGGEEISYPGSFVKTKLINIIRI